MPNTTNNTDSAEIPDNVALEALLSSAKKHEASKTNKNDTTRKDSWRRRQRQDDANSRQAAEGGRKKKSRWGSSVSVANDNHSNESVAPVVEKEKPNFAVSNALAKDSGQAITTVTGTSSGDQVAVVTTLKFSEPPEARIPNTQWRIYVFSSTKGDDPIATWHISKQSAYLFGRDEKICDIPIVHHPSTSKQHAVLQYRLVNNQCKPYILDLESTNGTFVNQIRIDPARYYELKRGDVLRFGSSAREYVLLTEHTKESHIFK